MKTIFSILIFTSIICNAEINENEYKYFRVAEILKLPKNIRLNAISREEFELKEGVTRIWAYSITDNKSYMLWLQEGQNNVVKLIEFDGNSQKTLKTNNIESPEWLSKLFDEPFDLKKKDMQIGASIHHSFIIERVKNSKYLWAYREIETGTKSVYSNLLNLLTSASINPLDVGWAIDIPLKLK